MFKVLLIALLLITSTLANDSVFRKFMEYTHEFDKHYTSPEEFLTRFAIFKTNLLDVLAHDKFSSEQHKRGINQFSDLTFEEFKATYLNLKAPSNKYCSSSKLEFYDAPASHDWRAKGMVSDVKNQGSCGSCWAFSVVGFLESQSLMKGKKDKFTEQQLVDCNKTTYGCQGGWPDLAFKYLQTAGIEAEASYPYTARDGTCQYSSSKVIGKTANVKCWENPTVATLQSQLYTIGPLTIVVDASDFQSYSSGVLSCRHNSSMNHAVLLVGYTPDSWIIKNSWGKNWGQQGFITVSNKTGQNCLVGSYMVSSDLN